MNTWLHVVKQLPPGLRRFVIKKAYAYKTHSRLNSVRFYPDPHHFVYETEGVFIPAGLLHMFATYDYYQQWVHKLSAWAYKPVKGDIVVDIGAGIGEEVLVFSRMVQEEGMVYSIEANPDVFSILNDIISLNRLNNVSLHNLAIACENGKMQLHVSDSAYVVGSFEQTESSQRHYDIETIRMDDFITKNRIAKIDLLKANIEGAERFVTGSIGDKIRCVRHVAIACHDFRYREEGNEFFRTKNLVKEFLQDNHFTLQTQQTSVEDFNDWVYGKNMAYEST